MTEAEICEERGRHAWVGWGERRSCLVCHIRPPKEEAK